MYYWPLSKNFTLPKNGGHFEFLKFYRKWKKTQICFYLLNCARSSDFVKIFDPQGIKAFIASECIKRYWEKHTVQLCAFLALQHAY